MNWSPQQETALKRVADWLRAPDSPYFYLAGFAGTGKSTLARYFAESVSGLALFATFTAKAASVMRSMGCYNAGTIHQLIYRAKEKSAEHLRALEKYRDELKAQNPVNDIELQKTLDNIKWETQNLRRPSFSLNLESELRHASLLTIDEVSMVDMQMGADLLSFGVPILVLGDPAQLPPIRGTGFFTAHEPDYMLTEVHRQALESPVLAMATKVRNGESLDYGTYGDSSIVREVQPEKVVASDQIICGYNTTRNSCNWRMRDLKGIERNRRYPLKGEKLVCLRNNHDLGIQNGATYRAVADAIVDDYVHLKVVTDDAADDAAPLSLRAHPQIFLGRGDEISAWDRRDAEECDFGYALTCHKAQGSGWDRVVLFDEWFRDYRKEWFYTALTRAIHSITVVRR